MKNYLFDFDGTLVDSMPTYARMFLGILERYSISYPENIINIITPLGADATAEYLHNMGVPIPTEQILDEMRDYLKKEYRANVFAKENVKDTLITLKRRGASLNVLTASPHVSLDPCLKNNGIYDLFDNIWSCEDFDTTKTDTKIYHMAAERMGVDLNRILFVDDNLDACKTAKAAGTLTCGIYDESSKDLVNEIKAETDFYVFDFKDILKLNI